MLIFCVGFLVGLLLFWPVILIGLMVWGGCELRQIDREEEAVRSGWPPLPFPLPPPPAPPPPRAR